MPQIDSKTKALQNSIFQSKVARARQQPIDEKIFEGPRLFDQVCQRMRDGIRQERPQFTDDEVEDELRRRLAITKRIDERGFYEDAGYIDE